MYHLIVMCLFAGVGTVYSTANESSKSVPAESKEQVQGTEVPKRTTKTKTLYHRFRDLFEMGKTPKLSFFHTNGVMTGTCVSVALPDFPVQSSLNIYVEGDSILGKMTYLIPVLFEGVAATGEVALKASERAIEFHELTKKEIRYFTALEASLPRGKASKAPTAKTDKSDLLFIRDKLQKRIKDPNAIVGIEFFRVRVNLYDLKKAIVLEKLCPEFGGCGCKEEGCKDWVAFQAPYLHCVFSDSYELIGKHRSYRQ